MSLTLSLTADAVEAAVRAHLVETVGEARERSVLAHLSRGRVPGGSLPGDARRASGDEPLHTRQSPKVRQDSSAAPAVADVESRGGTLRELNGGSRVHQALILADGRELLEGAFSGELTVNRPEPSVRV